MHHSRVTVESSAVEPPWQAQVVAAHGREFRVRTSSGDELRARLQRRGQHVVCGDQVRCRRDSQHDAVHIIEVLPRHGALYRSDARGRSELLAANLNLLVVVVAPVPAPDLFVVDRYLAAAASAGVEAALLANKSDLGLPDLLLQALREYQQLGYRCLHASRNDATSVLQVQQLVRDRMAMLVGQSGVGKSSLLRQLVPGSDAQVGELMRDESGRHTTTTTRCYQLPQGGALLDSPGVRDFAPAIERLDEHALGFVDIEQLATDCRFTDCRHLQEPGCAVRAALEHNRISARRYESYRRLRRLYNDLRARPGSGL